MVGKGGENMSMGCHMGAILDMILAGLLPKTGMKRGLTIHWALSVQRSPLLRGRCVDGQCDGDGAVESDRGGNKWPIYIGKGCATQVCFEGRGSTWGDVSDHSCMRHATLVARNVPQKVRLLWGDAVFEKRCFDNLHAPVAPLCAKDGAIRP